MSVNTKKVLLIAYFYPPIGGAGLPGAQRAVKIVKYLDNSSLIVLSVKESDYPANATLNFNRQLPIKNEVIIRTSLWNFFGWLLSARSIVWKLISYKGTNGDDVGCKDSAYINSIRCKKATVWQRIKDLVYELCNLPDYASGWIIPAIIEGIRITKQQKIDVILATGMPWSALVVAWVIHKISGAKLVVDFRDPWINNPFNLTKGCFLEKINRYLESRIVLDADLVSANTGVLKQELVERHLGKTDISKFIVLPNGFDPDDFKDLEIAGKRHSNGSITRLVLAHAGGLYGKRDPSPILEAIRSLEVRGLLPADSFRFVQMGSIQLDYDFRGRYREFERRGVLVDLGLFPYEQCLKELVSADVLLLIQPGTKSQVPSKLYDYLCLKRPILTMTPLDGALGELILNNQFGDIFSPDDVPGIANRLYTLFTEKTEKGQLCTEYIHKNRYDIRNIVKDLESSINKICTKN